jgi:pulcherriminic acid synthase
MMRPQPPDIFSAEFARDPYRFYAVMRKEHPLFFHEGTQSFILSRHEDVSRALKDPVFSTRNYAWQLEPIHGRTLMQKEGKELAAQRSLVQPWFRGRSLQDKVAPRIAGIAKQLIDGFRDTGEVELIRDFTTRFPLSVIVDLLGFPRSEHARFHGWHKAILGFLANLKQDPAVRQAGLQARGELNEYVLPLIAARRAQPQDDLLSALCNGEVDGWRLADSEIVGFCGSLLGAGGSTTDKALANLWKNLLDHPEQLAAVRADRGLIDQAFAETLRYSPPIHMIMRVPNEAVRVSGGTIPADATVTCLLASANRDETKFVDADRFDIRRKECNPEKSFSGGAEHAAFGFGRHFCVGATLARVEVKEAMNQLLDAMHDVRFADGVSPPEVGLFSRAPTRLELRFTPEKLDR